MHWSDLPFHPSARTLRQFAGLWLVFFGGMAVWQGAARGRPVAAVVLGLAAVAIGVLGLVRPRAVRLLFVAWMVLAFPIGWAVSRLLLAAAFYGVVTPVGLLLRLVGRDPLQRRLLPDQTTYWAARPSKSDVRRYFRQF